MLPVTGRGGEDGNPQLPGKLGSRDRARAVASSDDWRKSIHVVRA